MKFLKGLAIVIILITIYKAAGMEWLLDVLQDPASSVPSIEIGK